MQIMNEALVSSAFPQKVIVNVATPLACVGFPWRKSCAGKPTQASGVATFTRRSCGYAFV